MTLNNRFLHTLILVTSLLGGVQAQQLTEGLNITAETQISASGESSPLYLNANRYGLSSVESTNGYVRAMLDRPLEVDSAKQWKLGYGLDLAVAGGFTSTFIVQQAYAEASWKALHFTAGSKQQPIVFANQELTSGTLVNSANARPIPQLRLDIEYFPIPGTKGYWQWKAHGSYGMTTDGKWQKGFVAPENRYTSNTLYHEKALYWKFGKETNRKFPLTYEIGIQMCSQFGGTSYNAIGRNYQTPSTIQHSNGLDAFLKAFYMGGNDVTDGVENNVAGNHFGSYTMMLTYHGKDWKASARFERYFEDQSMLTVQYGIYDHLLGLDISLPKNPYVSALTVEHISTRDQSGAVYHDKTNNIPDKMNGNDNYYNHNLYSGNQHWGQSMGTPLITSPLYNEDHVLTFQNNRIKGWHIGISGDPCPEVHWRVLASFIGNWGTYFQPYLDRQQQNYFLAETTIRPAKLKKWSAVVGLGLDRGTVIGNNFGAQLTIKRTIL